MINISFVVYILFSLGPKLNTELRLHTHHPPTRNFSEGSKPSRKLRLEMLGLSKLKNLIPQP